MMLMLVMVLVLVMFVGVGFFNLTLMNTTTQSASLSAQTQLDRYCSPGFMSDCSMGTMKADAAINEIVKTAEPQLMFIVPGTLGYQRTLMTAGQSAPAPVPDRKGVHGGGGTMQPGWGYSFVRLQASFSIWNKSDKSVIPALSGQVPISTQALTPSYKEPGS